MSKTYQYLQLNILISVFVVTQSLSSIAFARSRESSLQRSSGQQFFIEEARDGQIFAFRGDNVQVRGASDSAKNLRWVSTIAGEQSVWFQFGKHDFSSFIITQKSENSEQHLKFVLNRATSSYRLVSVDKFKSQRASFSNDELDDVGSASAAGRELLAVQRPAVECDPRWRPSQIDVSGLLRRELAHSEKIKSCGASADAVAGALVVIKSRFLACLETHPTYLERSQAIGLEISEPNSGLKISCSGKAVSSSEVGEFDIELGADALSDAASDQTTLTKILAHEMLHSSGLATEREVNSAIEVCADSLEDHQTNFGSNETTFRSAVELARSTDSNRPIPTQINVHVGAADNLERARPAIARYRDSSRVLGREATRVMARLEPGLVSTARASTRRSAEATGSTEVYSVDERGTTLQLPSGELTRVSIPFSQANGFGAAKIEMLGMAPSTGASSLNVASAIVETGGGGSAGGSDVAAAPSAGKRGVSAVAPSLSSSTDESGGSGSESGSLQSISGSGLSAPAAGAAMSRNAGSARNTREAPIARVGDRRVETWSDARSMLARSPNPDQLLREPWFQNHLREFGVQVYFRGKPYGPRGTRTWNLDPYWKPRP